MIVSVASNVLLSGLDCLRRGDEGDDFMEVLPERLDILLNLEEVEDFCLLGKPNSEEIWLGFFRHAKGIYACMGGRTGYLPGCS